MRMSLVICSISSYVCSFKLVSCVMVYGLLKACTARLSFQMVHKHVENLSYKQKGGFTQMFALVGWLEWSHN